MALELRAQALSLLLAFAGGAALGLLYDLLRPLRRHGGDGLWDLLFCFCAAALCFVFAMRAESGVLGTGELLLALLGLLAYLRLLSPTLCAVLARAAQKLGAIWINTQDFAKKVARRAKKLFAISHE